MIAKVCFTDILCAIQVLVTEYNTVTVDVRDWISIHCCKSSIMTKFYFEEIYYIWLLSSTPKVIVKTTL